MTPEVSTQLEHYVVDPAASTFTVQAFAEGLFSAFGHDPLIGIKAFSGEMQFVPGTFENASLNLTIRPDSLVVVNNIKEKDRQEIEQTMREQVLEIRKYPGAFKSNNIA